MTDICQSGVDLPWGSYGERYTTYEDSFTFLTLECSDVDVVATTDDGWPTVILGQQDGTPVGVAIVHVTQLNDKPAEEIDIFVDAEHNWWVLVEFAELSAAVSGGQYKTAGYNGYEKLPCERRSEGFDLFNAYAESRITPIFELTDNAAAFAIQRSSEFEPLQRLFRLDEYSQIATRQNRLERRVLPREEWLENNPLTGVARDLSKDT